MLRAGTNHPERRKMGGGTVASVLGPAKGWITTMERRHHGVAMYFRHQRGRRNRRDERVSLHQAAHARDTVWWRWWTDTPIHNVFVGVEHGNQAVECLAIGPADAVPIDVINGDADDLQREGMGANGKGEVFASGAGYRLRVAQEAGQRAEPVGNVVGENDRRCHQRASQRAAPYLVESAAAQGHDWRIQQCRLEDRAGYRRRFFRRGCGCRCRRGPLTHVALQQADNDGRWLVLLCVQVYLTAGMCAKRNEKAGNATMRRLADWRQLPPRRKGMVMAGARTPPERLRRGAL